MHWRFSWFPAWADASLGIALAPFMFFCAEEIVLGDYRVLTGWVVLAYGVAALMHWRFPWFRGWTDAGLFGVLTTPTLCWLIWLLPGLIKYYRPRQLATRWWASQPERSSAKCDNCSKTITRPDGFICNSKPMYFRALGSDATARVVAKVNRRLSASPDLLCKNCFERRNRCFAPRP